MKFKPLHIFVALVFAGVACLSMTQIQSRSITSLADNTAIQWTDIETAMERSKKDGKPVFVDVYTDWCGWCKVMDKNTFSNAEIIEYVNKNYHAVKLNAEKNEVLTFGGQNMSPAQLSRDVFKVRGYPTIVFIHKQNINPVPGYQDATAFKALLVEKAAQ